MTKQQGREFTSTDPPTRTQDARFQERRVSAKISLNPRHDLQHIQRSTPPYLSQNAPSLPGLGDADMARSHRRSVSLTYQEICYARRRSPSIRRRKLRPCQSAWVAWAGWAGWITEEPGSLDKTTTGPCISLGRVALASLLWCAWRKAESSLMMNFTIEFFRIRPSDEAHATLDRISVVADNLDAAKVKAKSLFHPRSATVTRRVTHLGSGETRIVRLEAG